MRHLQLLLTVTLLAAPLPAVLAADAAIAVYSGTGISWKPQVDYDFVSLRVVGPNGYLYEQDFGAAQPGFNLKSGARKLGDGQYRYELVFGQAASGDRNQPGPEGTTHSGSFLVVGGAIRPPSLNEETASASDGLAITEDVVHNDDLIVVGSLCAGFDCVNNELFGLENVLLKQNNNRIKFDDTSITAGFPANDWQITVNADNSGGLNMFSVQDLTGGKMPFTIVAGAPTSSLYVDSSGRIGAGTSTPTQKIQATSGDTPALRLEQNGSSGFTPQSWDIAGNEANFFVRDVTSGNTLPFRIRPGAPSSSIDIAANGNVGLGTGTPSAALQVSRTVPANTQVSLRLTNSVSSWDIKNNGDTGRLTYTDDATGVRVPFKFGRNAVDNLLRVGVVNTSTVDVNGTLTVNGTFNNLSSREHKKLLPGPNSHYLLDALSDLPLHTWSYKHDGEVRHFGPVSEDFYARFGFGTDAQHISPNDLAGVALAATQALNTLLAEKVAEKDREIQTLKQNLSSVEERLARLEGRSE